MIYLDTEYSAKAGGVDPICLVAYSDKSEKYFQIDFLDFPEETNKVKELRKYLNQDKTLVCWSGAAEMGFLNSLGIDPIDYKWIDLKLGYTRLIEGWHPLRMGTHLKKTGGFSTNPFDKPSDSLLCATYKLLNLQEVSSERKEKMRSLCINYPKDPKAVKDNLKEIIDYCQSDVKNLPALYDKILAAWDAVNPSAYFHNAEIPKRKAPLGLQTLKALGEYSLTNYIKERNGYGVSIENLKRLEKNYVDILNKEALEINKIYPNFFSFKEGDKPKKNLDIISNLILKEAEKTNFPWPLSLKTKKPKLDSETLDSYGDFSDPYPKNPMAQYVRFQKLVKSLTGIHSKSYEDSIFSAIKGDRVHIYFPPMNSITARDYPKAKKFIHAKAKWLRAFVRPKKGYKILTADYSSQEHYIAALLSKDAKMAAAYESGDPYLYLAKLCGAVPWEGTREEYENEREIYKVVNLSMQFGMGYKSLARSLTVKTGKRVTEIKAQKLISNFYNAYRKYSLWRERTLEKFKTKGKMGTDLGVVLWEPKKLLFSESKKNTVLNFPIQSMGANIKREAVMQWVKERGPNGLLFDLHDAIYVEVPSEDDNSLEALVHIMKKAFHKFTGSGKVRVDTKVITEDKLFFENPSAKKNFIKFKPFFEIS